MIISGLVRARRRATERGSRMHAEPPTQPPVLPSALPPVLPALEATATGGTVTVVLRGEFDLTGAGVLAGQLERIRESGPRRLIFETGQVAFMDVASARLVAGTERWLPAGVKPVISHPSPIVHRVLQVTGLDARCDLEPEP